MNFGNFNPVEPTVFIPLQASPPSTNSHEHYRLSPTTMIIYQPQPQPSHNHHTTITQPSHNHHTTITQPSHNHHTTITQPSHNHHTTITQPSHNHHTTITQPSHNHHTTITQPSHNHHTTITQPSHNHHTTITQPSHNHHTASQPQPANHHTASQPQPANHNQPTTTITIQFLHLPISLIRILFSIMRSNALPLAFPAFSSTSILPPSTNLHCDIIQCKYQKPTNIVRLYDLTIFLRDSIKAFRLLKSLFQLTHTTALASVIFAWSLVALVSVCFILYSFTFFQFHSFLFERTWC